MESFGVIKENGMVEGMILYCSHVGIETEERKAVLTLQRLFDNEEYLSKLRCNKELNWMNIGSTNEY